jgi:hypothetical protein
MFIYKQIKEQTLQKQKLRVYARHLGQGFPIRKRG